MILTENSYYPVMLPIWYWCCFITDKSRQGREANCFASRYLAPVEQKYSQLDKEGLSIIFGVRKFHQYLFGRKFTIQSDHRPLQHIFGETRPVPHMASARLQR